MKYVFIIEDESMFQFKLVDAIQTIDPMIRIRLFSDLEEFAKWINIAIVKGPLSLPDAGTRPANEEILPEKDDINSLVCVISKVEFLGESHIPLIKKTVEMFVRKEVCTAEQPTTFVLTAFDAPEFNAKGLEQKEISNILFKPFDDMIVKQHLAHAIEGRRATKFQAFTNQRVKAQVEMLKEIEIETLSEVGFVTRSKRPLELGIQTKYYAHIFENDRIRSVFARVVDCVEHPKIPGEHQVTLHFNAIEPSQISVIRKIIGENKNPKSSLLQFKDAEVGSDPMAFIVIERDEPVSNSMQQWMYKSFSNVQTISYLHPVFLMLDLDPKKAMETNKDMVGKFFSGVESGTVYFDLKFTNIMGFSEEIKPTVKLVGIPARDLTGSINKFSPRIAEEHREKFKRMILEKSLRDPDENVFKFKSTSDSVHFGKVLKVETINHPGHGEVVAVTISEVTSENMIQWFEKNSRLPDKIDGFIISEEAFTRFDNEWWTKIIEQVKSRTQRRSGKNVDPWISVMVNKARTEDEKVGWYPVVKDMFFKPLDRSLLLRKLKTTFPDLIVIDRDLTSSSIVYQDYMKAATRIEITEISEAGLVMKYPREIPAGEFREFVLWREAEMQAPNIHACCNYNEVGQGEEKFFNCFFVFFGMTDQFLKRIRIWIRDQYIASKEKG